MGLERNVGGSEALLCGRLSLFTPTLKAKGSVGTQQLVWRLGLTKLPSAKFAKVKKLHKLSVIHVLKFPVNYSSLKGK
jgi:hypothetical protein